MSYFPKTEPELLQWLNNLVLKLATHKTALNLSDADYNSLKADYAALSYILHDAVPAYRAKAQEWTTYKDLLKEGPIGTPSGAYPIAPTLPTAPAVVSAGIVPRVQALVQRIKNTPGYNEAMGQDLGVIAPSIASLALEEVKPKFKATAMKGNSVRLDWTKGKMDGVRVEGRRNNESEWTFLGDDRYSPFEDTRPLLKAGEVETRYYRMRYLKKDELVGDDSDIVQVQTIG